VVTRSRIGICLALLATSVGCDSKRVEVDGPCTTTFDCVDGAVCFSVPGAPEGQGRCMAECTADERLCVGGEVCLAAASDPSTRVCYLGGPSELGDECGDATDCELGSVCVDLGDGSAPSCVLACDLRSPDTCPMGFACEALTEPAGFCALEPEEETAP
jgi:hypothetical protein